MGPHLAVKLEDALRGSDDHVDPTKMGVWSPFYESKNLDDFPSDIPGWDSDHSDDLPELETFLSSAPDPWSRDRDPRAREPKLLDATETDAGPPGNPPDLVQSHHLGDQTDQSASSFSFSSTSDENTRNVSPRTPSLDPRESKLSTTSRLRFSPLINSNSINGSKDELGSGSFSFNELDTKWPISVETSFVDALRLICKNGNSKLKVGNENYGRNQLISLYIKYQTGKTRTKKQISSHIQVWKKGVVAKIAAHASVTPLEREVLRLIESGAEKSEANLRRFSEVFEEVINDTYSKTNTQREDMKEEMSLDASTNKSRGEMVSEIKKREDQISKVCKPFRLEPETSTSAIFRRSKIIQEGTDSRNTPSREIKTTDSRNQSSLSYYNPRDSSKQQYNLDRQYEPLPLDQVVTHQAVTPHYYLENEASADGHNSIKLNSDIFRDSRYHRHRTASAVVSPKGTIDYARTYNQRLDDTSHNEAPTGLNNYGLQREEKTHATDIFHEYMDFSQSEDTSPQKPVLTANIVAATVLMAYKALKSYQNMDNEKKH